MQNYHKSTPFLLKMLYVGSFGKASFLEPCIRTVTLIVLLMMKSCLCFRLGCLHSIALYLWEETFSHLLHRKQNTGTGLNSNKNDLLSVMDDLIV